MRRDVAPTLATFPPDMREFGNIHMDEHMFREDVGLGVMPWDFGGSPNVQVAFDGDAVSAAAILADLGDSVHRTDHELITEAIDDVVLGLRETGRSIHEICRDPAGAWHLVPVRDEGIRVFPGFSVQTIPPAHRARYGKRYITVRTEKLWIVEMPPALGGRRGYAVMLRKLRSVDSLGPPFFKASLREGLAGQSYDFQTYAGAVDVFQERVTRKWHWDRRDNTGERTTDMYDVYKQLGFKAAQILMRDHVIAAVDSLLTRLGCHAKVRITGVKTHAELLIAQERFLAGRITFKEALAYCRN